MRLRFNGDRWPNKDIYKDLYIKSRSLKTFHIGQCYEDVAATTLRCKKCRGTKFHVGRGSHYTAIKCVTCRWEECVHDG